MNVRGAWCWAAVATLVLGAGGCSSTIVPPAASADLPRVPVMVADYGYHSTLILPRQEGGLIEYAYGDWVYFGNNNKSVATAVRALLVSDQATLGRRLLDRTPAQAGLEQALGAGRVLRFEAPREAVRALERELEERFARRLDTIHWSPVHQLYFVKDDERYGFANNCNHVTVKWLERLGCRVERVLVSSKFTVREREAGEGAVAGPPAQPLQASVVPAGRVAAR